MHDFIQHLSFNRVAPITPARPAGEPLRCLVRSFNEVPAPASRPPSGAKPRPSRQTPRP